MGLKCIFMLQGGRQAPVIVVHPMRPIDGLEQALPVTPVLHPELLLHAVAKFAVAGAAPQPINDP